MNSDTSHLKPETAEQAGTPQHLIGIELIPSRGCKEFFGDGPGPVLLLATWIHSVLVERGLSVSPMPLCGGTFLEDGIILNKVVQLQKAFEVVREVLEKSKVLYSCAFGWFDPDSHTWRSVHPYPGFPFFGDKLERAQEIGAKTQDWLKQWSKNNETEI